MTIHSSLREAGGGVPIYMKVVPVLKTLSKSGLGPHCPKLLDLGCTKGCIDDLPSHMIDFLTPTNQHKING